MDTDQHLTDWALYLAAMGWHVFPVAAGSKVAAIKDWENRATTDSDRITRCWATGPFNIGLATGPSHLVVVDLDMPKTDGDPDGITALAELAAARGVTLPDTYTVTTPSGGQHLYFTAPAGVHLRNTRGDLAPAIDTRAEGGYVLAAGSTLPAGGYELLDDTDPAELPAWLLHALCTIRPRHAAAPVRVTTGGRDRYVAAALAGECDRIRTAPAGHHNDTLSRAAYAIGQLVGAGLLDYAAARAALVEAGQAMVTGTCHCTPREIERVTDASLTAGQANPRSITATEEAA